MKTIWKFTLPITDHVGIEMPMGAKVISAGEQSGELVLWAIVDTDAHKVRHSFSIYGTGNPFWSPSGQFISTVKMQNGLVWHVFKD